MHRPGRFYDRRMYEISIQHEFCAAHTLRIAGTHEPVHGHNFRVAATISGETLDSDGLLCDFHTAAAVLRDICEPFVNAHLNETPPFDETNPTAELIARHIAEGMADRLDGALAPHARITAVRVTESPGCAATYRR